MTASKLRYPLARPLLGHDERRLLLEAFDSGLISSRGEFVKRFETSFSDYTGTSHGISTSNGTTALHLALLALDLKTSDEVIVSDLTFVAPANMVTYNGNKVVLADSNPEYWGVDYETISSKITKRTRAVIVVHLYGHPVDLNPIVELCEKKGISLIEDCAEAHGAKYMGKTVGGFGQISCFSFYGNKLLTTGEGGMCLTDDEDLADKMRILRDHGADPKRHFWHPELGFNYRMTNLQAAVGCAQLASLEKRIAEYRAVGHLYSRRLEDAGFSLHPEMSWATCVFWMYTTLIEGLTPALRENLEAKLLKQGIETRPMFYPISKLPRYYAGERFNPVANSLSRKGVSLPTFVGLKENDVDAICGALEKSSAEILG